MEEAPRSHGIAGPHTRGQELKKNFMCVHEGKVFIRVLIITNWIDEVKITQNIM